MRRTICCSSVLSAIVVVSVLLGVPALAAEPRWQPVGPFGHDGYRLFPTKDPEILYVTTLSSGLYRSDDGGQSWRQVNPALFGVLSIDPRDPDVLFGVSGKVLRSVDGGRTFTPAADGLLYEGVYPQIFSLLRDPGNPDVVFAATDAGLFRYDRMDWELIAFAGSAVTAFAIDPLAPAVWHAATTDSVLQRPAEMLVSTDAGATWTPVPGNIGRDEVKQIFYDPVRPHRAYALANCRPAVFIDGAWRPLPVPGSLFSCVATITDEGRLIASRFENNRNVLLASDDGGATWTRLATPEDILFRIAAPAGEDGTLIASGVRGLWRSVDDGATWRAASRGISGFNVGDIAIAADGTVFTSPGGEGVFRSRDTGRSWQRLVRGLQADALGSPTLATDPRNAAVVWAGRTQLHRSRDAGRTWEGMALPGGVKNREIVEIIIDPTREGVVYVRTLAPAGPGIVGPFNYRTLDDGRTWQPLPGFHRRGNHLAVAPSDGTFYIVSADGIFVSRDAGSTWQRVRRSLPALFFESFAVDPERPEVLWLASNDGVLRSSDGGRTFALLLEGELLLGPVGDFVFDPADTAHPYVVVGAAGVYQWRNAGWRKVGADDDLFFDRVVSSFMVLDAERGILYAGTSSRGIYRLRLR